MKSSYHPERRLQSVKVPGESLLAGQLLRDADLTTSFGLMVVGILRDSETHVEPGPDQKLEAGDVLLIRGPQEDLEVLEALQELKVNGRNLPEMAAMESDDVAFAEASLSSRTTFAGTTVRHLHFREKYGVSILAIWRNGKIYRSRIREMELLPGDAFLLYGKREKLSYLAGHPDFLVLADDPKRTVRKGRAPVSGLIMAGVLAAVISGSLPIFIAAPIGALFMVLTGCLKVEEAYQSIEWKAIVLIAGMLSLGLAMQETGTAQWVANAALGTLADFGPTAVLAGLFIITAFAAQVMPTAAVAVLMSPIALSTAQSEGLRLTR